MEEGYSVCLNRWALDKDIKSELGLLLIISSLCAREGYCFASNKYLAELFNITEQSVSNKIQKLENKNYIKIEYEKRGCEVISRKIRLKNFYTDDIKKIIPTIKEKFKDNNINIKNINNKIYYDNQELNNLFLEFLELRLKLKCKNTDRAIKLLLNELEKYDDEVKIQMINNSIMNSWKSVYPLKSGFKKQNVEPSWMNKEIRKEEISDEAERIYKEFYGEDKK